MIHRDELPVTPSCFISYLPDIPALMSNYYSEKLYDGPEAIVVSMDIGTTQSEQSSRTGANLIQPFRRCLVRLFHSRYSSSGTNGI
jgi:hypothetical protein